MNLLELLIGKKKEESVSKIEKKTFKIFLVDDNIAFSRLIESQIKTKITENLPNLSFEVTKFENGADCIQALSIKPNLILLDYYLSDNPNGNENGDEIFRQIKDIIPSQKVVMLSGIDETSISEKLLNLGLYGFVIKDEAMFEKIHTILKNIIN